MRFADALALVSVVVALTLGWVFLDANDPTAVEVAAATCVGEAEAWTDVRGRRSAWTTPRRLGANGALFACAPREGTVHLTLTGTGAAGRGAHAVVVVDGIEVWNDLVAAPVDLAFEARAGTPVLVAFGNDLYRPPEGDRDLWVSATTYTEP